MKSKIKAEVTRRILALTLVFTMLLSFMPTNFVLTAYAEGEPYTLTAVDQDGEKIVGATVEINYIITDQVSKEVLESNFESGLTDDNGIYEIQVLRTYRDRLESGEVTISLDSSVSKTGYKSYNTRIEAASDTKNYEVILQCAAIPGVEITSYTGDYDGEEHDAVNVTGTEAIDTVSYSLDGGVDWQNEVPTISEVGSLTVYVKVEREGYDPLEETVKAVISKSTITNIEIIPYVGDYNPDAVDGYDAVKEVKGTKAEDNVFYRLTEEELWQSKSPTIKNAGSYTVFVKIQRYGYNDYETSATAVVKPIPIEGVIVEPYTGIYDGQKHPVVTVSYDDVTVPDETLPLGHTIEYKLNGGEWTTEIPMVSEAGSYEVAVKINKNDDNYEEYITIPPVKVTIEKADQDLNFVNEEYNNTGEDTVEFDAEDGTNNLYSFAVTGGNITEDIVYTVENATNDGIDIEEIASIDENGQLTILGGGVITITATKTGDSNYNDVSISYQMTVTLADTLEHPLLNFSSTAESILMGENFDSLEATKTYNDDNGTITYRIDNADIGISIDQNSGVVDFNDYEKLGKELVINNGSITITVIADKTAGTKNVKSNSKEIYASAQATYTLTISFMPVTANPYVVTGTKETNDWYTTPVEVTPADTTTYSISDTLTGSFDDSVTIGTEGTEHTSICLKDINTGAMSAPIEVEDLKIDTVAPNHLAIEYVTTPIDSVLEVITLGFYNPSVTVKMTAFDETSKVDSFTWTYTSEVGASDVNKKSETATISSSEISYSDDGKTATTEFTLTANEAEQYRGNIKYYTTDVAGNDSIQYNDMNNTIIVDTISPTRTVEFSSPIQAVGETMYFDEDVIVTFNINEANFYSEDVEVTVSKDGGTASAVTPSWTDYSADEHQGVFTLSGDGDYIVYMTYKDKSGNMMEKYQSNVITIDKTTPVVDFVYDKTKQIATITIEEHNFRPSDITGVTVSAVNIKGEVVPVDDIENYLKTCEWTKNGDVYTAEISEWNDAIYNLVISYTDISSNAADDCKTGTFITDKTGPTDLEINYSTPTLEKIISGLTFGYYKPHVKVTVTAKDITSGVDTFKWQYKKQSGASSVNKDSESGVLTATMNDDVATAEFTLTASQAAQYRGNIQFYATDQFNNVSNTLSDSGKIVVVDYITPTRTVEISTADQVVNTSTLLTKDNYDFTSEKTNSILYYKDSATVTFTVNEANFYSEDVVVEVSKNGGNVKAVTPSWTDKSVDEHVGEITLSGDGDYVVYMTYEDRSTNAMKEYESEKIVIDTIAPTIDVSYSNTEHINKIDDRYYYDDVQTATISITERNFRADDVTAIVTAKNAAGEDVAVDDFEGYLSKRNNWVKSGDTYTATIPYTVDANYTFDIEYIDLAKNKISDYTQDEFTVDKTVPTDLKVDYSSNVFETILQAISFGFYDAQMTVRITADDATSGIYRFDYSYLKADGVSTVNAELINEAIAQAGIEYSNGRKTATTEFIIPRSALNGSNQFNGTVEFIAYDISDNNSELKDTERIVVDNIAPTATITFNNPINEENGVSYYAGNIESTIVITEANFYSEDVKVTATKDGAAYGLPVSWSNNSLDTHMGTFTLTEDGDYIITVEYADRSTNAMETYTSNQLTLDTTIVKPEITGVEDGGAYKNKVIPALGFEDINFDSYTATLTRTRKDEINVDVTEKFIQSLISETGTGISGTFDTFEDIQDNDGIYTLSVKAKDKAGNEESETVTFTVNRFGSVYAYNDYLVSLIKDGGAYVTEVTEDLMITEYNADKLVEGSLSIEITCDGKPLSNVDFDMKSTVNTTADSSTGWNQYQYTISKENFSKDGVYKMTISSEDATGNTPENTNYKDQLILFRVDSTAPEITSITGLEKPIINSDNVNVKYEVFDTIGLASVKVYINDEVVDTIEDFTGDANNYTGSFIIDESTAVQTVKLVVTDLAGNVTDTSSEEFTSAYIFNSDITVSTNFFVRWFANKPFFWGAITLIVALIGGGMFKITARRKKKEVTEVN